MPHVTEVHIYPIKGMQPATRDGGEPIVGFHSTHLGMFQPYGVYDRSLFVAAEDADHNLTFVSPRGWANSKGPKMAHPNDSRLAGVEVDLPDFAELHLRAKGVGELALSMHHSLAASESQPVGMFGGKVWGFDMGPKAADFVSAVIGRPARIMMTDFNKPREASDGRHKKALAADGHGYLVTSQATLDELNRLNEGAPDVPMSRYRPNIVVDTFGEPGAEYRVSEFSIISAGFKVASASPRCAVTNVDHHGERVGGGLRVLRPHRGVQLDAAGQPIPGSENAYFGINANSTSEDYIYGRMVMVGDPLSNISHAAHPSFRAQ